MAASIRSVLADIIPAVRTQLAAYTDVSAPRIKLSRKSRVPKLDGDADLLIRLQWPEPVQSWSDGGGRAATPIRRILAIRVRSRWEGDESDMDNDKLIGSAGGHYLLEDQVLDALQMFYPTDSQGNGLLIEPMRIMGGLQADEDGRDTGWTESALHFEICYLQALTQSTARA